MRSYDLLFITDPKLTAEELSALNERVGRIIGTDGSEEISRDDWGARRLAYPVGHLNEGRYTLVRFKSDPSKIAAMERQLRLIQKIIRFIIVRQED
ncbi:MAG: 30S ribosomal protein S6 [bacterium]